MDFTLDSHVPLKRLPNRSWPHFTKILLLALAIGSAGLLGFAVPGLIEADGPSRKCSNSRSSSSQNLVNSGKADVSTYKGSS